MKQSAERYRPPAGIAAAGRETTPGYSSSSRPRLGPPVSRPARAVLRTAHVVTPYSIAMRTDWIAKR